VPQSKAYMIASNEMRSGLNCCQSILFTASKLWDMPVDEKTLAMASLFAEGMDSGCTCGALVGMMMASGLMKKSFPHPSGDKLASQIHDRFKQEFGSTCCRSIKAKRSILEKIGRDGCIKLTGRAAEILAEEWDGVINNGKDSDIRHNPDVK